MVLRAIAGYYPYDLPYHRMTPPLSLGLAHIIIS